MRKKEKKIEEKGIKKFREDKKAEHFLEKFVNKYLEMIYTDPIAFSYVCLRDIHYLRLFLREKELYSEWTEYRKMMLTILKSATDKMHLKKHYEIIEKIGEDIESIESSFDEFEN